MGFKVISKVLVNRMKCVVPQLVSSNQCSFIPGRQMHDNVIILQEVIHLMHKKSMGPGWIVLKVDLEKAYDRIRWDFILETLRQANFPSQWCSIVDTYLCYACMRVLWNNKVSDSFLPTRGVCQERPDFPYLFVLAMKLLGHLILKLTLSGD